MVFNSIMQGVYLPGVHPRFPEYIHMGTAGTAPARSKAAAQSGKWREARPCLSVELFVEFFDELFVELSMELIVELIVVVVVVVVVVGVALIVELIVVGWLIDVYRACVRCLHYWLIYLEVACVLLSRGSGAMPGLGGDPV